MGREERRTIAEPRTVRALAHPVRLELLTYLMSHGASTASQCARAVGDTPSNCSYHLRALAKVGLVARDESADGRERPWRALVTGLDTTAGGELLDGLIVQRDQRLVREHLARRDRLPEPWREAAVVDTYTLRLAPHELRRLAEAIDALIRPYIAPLREDAPTDAAPVHVGFHAIPLPDAGGSR